MKKILTIVCCFALLSSLIPGQRIITKAANDDTTVVADATGTNDDVMDKIIAKSLDETEKLPESDGKDWYKFLDDEWREVSKSFQWKTTTLSKWGGQISSVAKDATNKPETNPMVVPEIVDGVYEVYYGEQLYYALAVPYAATGLKLMNDIDLNGSEYAWNEIANVSKYNINGNNHTIYNLGGTKSFINILSESTVSDLHFENTKLVTEANVVLSIFSNAKNSTLRNISFKNSIFFSAYPEYNPMGNKASYTAPIGHSKGMTAEKIVSDNNIVYARKAHSGGAFAAIESATIKDSYSINSTIIAGGNHSGGFISCGNGGNTVSNSFTNNTVFGNEETGVFIGALVDNVYDGMDRNDSFINCFTSGSIEGTSKLGGFVGVIKTATKYYSVSFKNCYSTSIVGMRKGGSSLGGFVGTDEDHEKKYVFEDCFVAGEVGAIDTDLNENPAEHKSTTVGGFLGSTASTTNLQFINSYYDKQTTAMREWEAGTSRDVLGTEVPGYNNIQGLKGVLTSNSTKFGAGLASQPIPATGTFDDSMGFTGFTGDVKKDGGIYTNPNWIYDGGNENPSLHNCMYPQLEVFFNSTDPLIRAFSYASVATVHEQVWDTCTHGKPLPMATYDTIRDLTSRFTLTSYVDNPAATADGASVDIKWTKIGVETNLYGRDQQVIGLFTKAQNSKYNRPYWTADKFAPGTEWVKAEFTIEKDGKSYVGSRRLRIIPTSNITPGNDQIDLITGDTYNHAKDMFMAYSTAQRMANDEADITKGVYPDMLPFASTDIRSIIQTTNQTIETQFKRDAKNFIVGGEHLTRATREVGEDHPNNIVISYLYGVKSFDEVGGSDTAKINYGTKDDAIISPAVLNGEKGEERKALAENWIKKLTGGAEFEDADEGRYLIEYEWVLPDGRYMRDSKMVMVQRGEHNVSTEVRNTDDQKLNNGSLKLSIDKFDYSASVPNPTFTETASSASIDVEHGIATNIAFKEVNADTKIDKIVFEFQLSDIASSESKQTVTIENVTVDSVFQVPITYFYSSFEENGNYYARKATTTKEYTLKKHASGYYYLTLNDEFKDASTGLDRRDIECDVKATIYVTDVKVVNTGKMILQTQTIKDGTHVYLSDKFQYKINKDDGTSQTIEVSSEKDVMEELVLPVGTYSIEQLNNFDYPLKEVRIDDVVANDTYSFTVETDGVSNIVFTNEKITPIGTAKVDTQTFINNERVFNNETFQYKIVDDAGDEVETINVKSDNEPALEVVLPVGNYKIEPLTDHGYQLNSIKVGDNVIQNAPYAFSITKDGTITITATYHKEVVETGIAALSAETFINNEQVYQEETFEFSIVNSDDQEVTRVELESKRGEVLDVVLPVGDYKIVSLTDHGYQLNSMKVGDNVIQNAPYAFSITKDGTTTITATYHKEVAITGIAALTAETFINNERVFNNETFQYKIVNDTGDEVDVIDVKSDKEPALEVELPVGNYKIEPLTDNEYQLKSIKVDNNVIQSAPYAFSITKDGTTTITATYHKEIAITGIAALSAKTFINNEQVFQEETFAFSIVNLSGHEVKRVEFESKQEELLNVVLPVGDYKIEPLTDNGYQLKSIKVGDNVIQSAPYAFSITKDGTTTITATYHKEIARAGTAALSAKTFINNEQVYQGETFAFSIVNLDNHEVKRVELESKQGEVLNIVLPVGNYKIEPLTDHGYQLKSIKVGNKIIQNEPYEFSITEDGTTTITATYHKVIAETGIAAITAQTFINNEQVFNNETFQYKIVNDAGDEVKTIDVKSDNEPALDVELPVGDYKIEPLTDHGYQLNSIKVGDNVIQNAPYAFSITKDGTITITATYHKEIVETGIVALSAQTFINNEQVFNNETFQFKIINNAGDEVETIDVKSDNEPALDVELPVGDYKIEPLTDHGYQLNSIKVGDNVIQNAPYAFSITKDGTITITATYHKEIVETGIAALSVQTFINNQQVYQEETFAFSIVNLDDQEVTRVELESKRGEVLYVVLPVGDYKIVSLTDHGYQLNSMKVGDNVIQNAPYAFSITKDGTIAITATYHKEVAITGIAALTAETFINNERVFNNETFQYKIVNATGDEVEVVDVKSDNEPALEVELPVGNYKIEPLTDNEYQLKSIKVDNKVIQSAPYAFSITKDGTTTITATYHKEIAETGIAALSAQTFINNEQVFQEETFAFSIVNLVGHEVKRVEFESKQGEVLNVVLPVGDYKIEPLTDNEYQLKSIKVGDNVIQNAPYAFSITKDGTITITATYHKEIAKAGTAALSVQTFINNEQVYQGEIFAFSIVNLDNHEVKRVELDSKQGEVLNIVLPVGNYKIEPLTDHGYQLKSIKVGNKIIQNEPYEFSITEDGTIRITATYHKVIVETGIASITAQTFINNERVFNNETFQYKIVNNAGDEVETIDVKSDNEPALKVELPVGDYKIESLTDHGYQLKSIKVGDNVIQNAPYAFSITKDGTTTITATYHKEIVETGIAALSAQTFINNEQVFDNETFQYKIVNDAGDEVETIDVKSDNEPALNVELPVGDYKIEPLTDNGYQLNSIKIGNNVIQSAPYAFSITKDGTTTIIATYHKEIVETGIVALSAQTFINNEQVFNNETFQYKIVNDAGDEVETIDVKSDNEPALNVELPVGDYKIEPLTDNGYQLNSIKIGDNVIQNAPYAFSITKDGTITITATYHKEIAETGIAALSAETFINNQQVYQEETFAFSVVNLDNQEVTRVELESKQGEVLNVVLPVGNYKIEPLTDHGYQLKSIKVGDNVIQNAPYAFSITKDGTIAITATYHKEIVETGTAALSVQTFINNHQVYQEETFAFAIVNLDGQEVKRVEVKSKQGEVLNVVLPIGDYKLKPLNNNGYKLLHVSVNSTDFDTIPVAFSVKKDETISLTAKYQKEIASLGTVTISNETFENGSRTFTVTPFEYKILDGDGNLVESFSLTSEKDKKISYELPIGTYTIVQSLMQGYTLESININGSVYTAAPFTFIVDENGEVVIVTKNILDGSGVVPPTPGDNVPPTSDDDGSLPPSNNVITGMMQQSNSLYIFLGITSAMLICMLYSKKKRSSKKAK